MLTVPETSRLSLDEVIESAPGDFVPFAPVTIAPPEPVRITRRTETGGEEAMAPNGHTRTAPRGN